MKKNSLTTALLAGLAGAAGLATTAHAVNPTHDVLGNELVFPYYTVRQLPSVPQIAGDLVVDESYTVGTLTPRAPRVERVRFMEARNAQEVLDFDLYLTPLERPG